jgi:hypothetical protein
MRIYEFCRCTHYRHGLIIYSMFIIWFPMVPIEIARGFLWISHESKSGHKDQHLDLSNSKGIIVNMPPPQRAELNGRVAAVHYLLRGLR